MTDDPNELSFPASWKQPRPRLADRPDLYTGPDYEPVPALHSIHGTPPPTNPDTGLPMPSPTPEDLELVAELLDRSLATGDQAHARVRELLTEAVVRARGRELRNAKDLARIKADGHRTAAGRAIADAAGQAVAGNWVAAHAACDTASYHLAAAATLGRDL